MNEEEKSKKLSDCVHVQEEAARGLLLYLRGEYGRDLTVDLYMSLIIMALKGIVAVSKELINDYEALNDAQITDWRKYEHP